MYSHDELIDTHKYKRLLSGKTIKAIRRIAESLSREVGTKLTDEQALLIIAQRLEDGHA